LDGVVIVISGVQSALNFFEQEILICLCLSQLFEPFYTFKRSFRFLYVVILSCIVYTLLEHTYAKLRGRMLAVTLFRVTYVSITFEII
jgi:hypothetical protein